MKTLLLLSLALALTFAAPLASAETDHCVGVQGVQQLCSYYGPTGEECYYWDGIVLDGHHVC